MFEVPQSKRVKRSDVLNGYEGDQLHPPQDEAASSSQNRNKKASSDQDASRTDNQVPDYGFTYDYVQAPVPTSSTVHAQNTEEVQAYEFNLFRPLNPLDLSGHQQPHESEPSSHLRSAKSPAQSPTSPPNLNPDIVTQHLKPSKDLPNAPSSHHKEDPKIASQTKTNIITISARSPTPDTQLEPGLSTVDLEKANFVRPRPESYYFTSALSLDQRARKTAEYVEAAISSDELTTAARRSWPGTALRWREIHISPLRLVDKTGTLVTGGATVLKAQRNRPAGSRTRPSKAQRIMARKVVQKTKMAQRTAVEKEAAEREKRNAKNRAQKIKRRAKERERKAQARLTEDAVGKDTELTTS